MPTIKDIARAAGVSHATVSNVLNHKGNVSAQKIRLVMDAAQAMGYRVNEAASTLRSGSAQTLAVILPDTGSAAYDDLYRSLCQTADEYGFNTLLRLTDNVLGTEERAIEDVLASRARCAVVVTSLPDAAQRYELLRRAGIKVVFAIRGAQPGFPYAGFDLEQAAQDMARRVLADDGALSIGLMTGMTCYPSQAAFRTAFLSAARGCRITCVESVPTQYRKQAFSLFDADGPDAIVTTNEEMARAVLEAGHVLGRTPRVYSLAPERLLHPNQYTPYALNYRRLGCDMARMLMDESAPLRPLSGDMPGFAPRPPRYPAPHHPTLSLLTADTPVSRALERLLPRLKQDTGLQLSITTRPTQEVSQTFSQREQIDQFDLARMDLALMNRWAPELLMPLGELQLDADRLLKRFLPGLATEYSIVGGIPYALPFDPGCHLLFYRKDVFQDPHFQREYYEKWHENLCVPATREELLHVAQCLTEADLHQHGLAHPLLLTRRSSECLSALSSLCGDRPLTQLTPADMEQYVATQRALESCAAFVENGSWSSAVSRFARGDCALLIAHSNYARHLADEPLSSVSGRVGFALSPGQRTFLGGGVIGVVQDSPRKAECATFLRWLFSPEISRSLSLLSGCSPLTTAYESEELTDIYPWLGTVQQGLTGGVRRQLLSGSQPRLDLLSVEKKIARCCDRAVQGHLSLTEAFEQLMHLVS